MNSKYDVLIVGGGAAGFFTAINIAEKNQGLKIAILERGNTVLSKVKISGGGRCNVTHACFVANELSKNYPRGEKELKGPFHSFGSSDTVAWFEKKGVALKIEPDGRMFPVSNSSKTIVDCFETAAKKLRIDVLLGQSVQSIFKAESGWKLDTNTESFACEKIVLTTGSNPKIWNLLAEMGHSVVEPVPSLFTFNIKDARIKDLMGLSANGSLQVKGSKLCSSGPILITHWGLSGPCVLKISAWGARILAEKNYQFSLLVNWLNGISFDEVVLDLKSIKLEHAKKTVVNKACFDLPNRLWENLVLASSINADTKWADLTKIQLLNLAQQLTNCEFIVDGKSTFKEEFVTAGGIDLKEINFKTMESKLHKNLFFAGEIVNVDAITGGFNFQNAWTSGFIVAKSI